MKQCLKYCTGSSSVITLIHFSNVRGMMCCSIAIHHLQQLKAKMTDSTEQNGHTWFDHVKQIVLFHM